MITLGIDGGAERLGWSLLERVDGKPVYLDSGLVALPYKTSGLTFQEYRLALTEFYVDHLTRPGSVFDPSYLKVEQVVTEILPPVGFSNGVQAYLVNVALTIVQSLAILAGVPVYQIGATTVQKHIAINKVSKKVSKVQVRNGVFELLPELRPRKSEWTKVFDEPDAIAVALAFLGFKNNG